MQTISNCFRMQWEACRGLDQAHSHMDRNAMSSLSLRRLARPTLMALLGFAAALTASGSPAKADVFQTTFEAAGVQNANQTALCAANGSGNCKIGVESFDTRTSNTSFTTDFGTGGVINGTYTAVQINAADQYGGAGGTGKYAVAFSGTPYQVSLTTTLATGINYFGFWLSALDSGNQVSFYNGSTLVYTFTPTNLINALGSCSSSNAYCGNPTAAHLGQNSTQLYAFVNFFDTTGTFNSVHFQESPANGGYESDNQTVGFVTSESGTVVSIAEPASFALLAFAVAGFGMVHCGAAIRMRNHNRDAVMM